VFTILKVPTEVAKVSNPQIELPHNILINLEMCPFSTVMASELVNNKIQLAYKCYVKYQKQVFISQSLLILYGKITDTVFHTKSGLEYYINCQIS